MEVGEAVGAVGPEVVDAGEEVLHAGVVTPGRGEVERRVAGRESSAGSTCLKNSRNLGPSSVVVPY